MDPGTLERFGARPLPRYTSYPTAPKFHEGVDAGRYGDWLGCLNEGERVSLYLHVPFCRQLCWYCGCHTRVLRRDHILADYAGLLARELALVAEAAGGRCDPECGCTFAKPQPNNCFARSIASCSATSTNSQPP